MVSADNGVNLQVFDSGSLINDVRPKADVCPLDDTYGFLDSAPFLFVTALTSEKRVLLVLMAFLVPDILCRYHRNLDASIAPRNLLRTEVLSLRHIFSGNLTACRLLFALFSAFLEA